MNNKFKIVLSIFLIVLASETLFCQVTISKSEVDYSLKIEKDSILRILTFWKEKDSELYTSVKYSVSDFNVISSEKILENEIKSINQLWDIASDSIIFNLQSFNIVYPLLYSDILKNHIQAFIDSENWQNHVKLNGKTLNYEIIKMIMEESNVYKPLNVFLNTKNYYISGFETEKHGFVTKENLQKAGYQGTEIIPMPFIIWDILERSK